MKLVFRVLLVSALMVGGPALADPHGHPHDGGPPGLAKKPYGMPPGQAKKMWRAGERLPSAYYRESRYYVVEPDRYGLRRPPPGYRWVYYDDDAYLVRRDNGLIADVVADALVRLLR